MKTFLIGNNFIELPEVTTAEKNSIEPKKTMVVYDTDNDRPEIYNGAAWVSFFAGTPTLDDVTNAGNVSGSPILIGGYVAIVNDGGKRAILNADALTAHTNIALQDGSGTVAFLSDIPTPPTIPTPPAGFLKIITSGEESGFTDARLVGSTFSMIQRYNGTDNVMIQEQIDYVINPTTGAITLTFFANVLDGDVLKFIIYY